MLKRLKKHRWDESAVITVMIGSALALLFILGTYVSVTGKAISQDGLDFADVAATLNAATVLSGTGTVKCNLECADTQKTCLLAKAQGNLVACDAKIKGSYSCVCAPVERVVGKRAALENIRSERGNQVLNLCPGPNDPEHVRGAEHCFDTYDNDCNGLANCADPVCNEQRNRKPNGEVIVCQSNGETLCRDQFDNDGDGLIDCLDQSCDGVALFNGLTIRCEFSREVTCSDHNDNDGDGLIDCADPDCDGLRADLFRQELCTFGGEIHCADSIDNDGNNLVDCDEPLCAQTQWCQNLIEPRQDQQGNPLLDSDGDGINNREDIC